MAECCTSNHPEKEEGSSPKEDNLVTIKGNTDLTENNKEDPEKKDGNPPAKIEDELTEQEDSEEEELDSEAEEEERRKKKELEIDAEFHPQAWYRRNDPVEKLDSIDIVPLTEENKEVIRETWGRINDHMTENGTKIFLRIFEVNSHIRSVFHFAEHTPLEELAENAQLQNHATRFMLAMQTAVENMDELNTLIGPIFINLGKRHIYFQNLKDDFFQVFSGAMMFVWRENLGDELTPPVRQGWSRLFDFILQHLKFGYEIALEKKLNKKK